MGVPIPTVMSISDHKTEKNFKKYIKAGGLEHAQIMKKYRVENDEKIEKLKKKRVPTTHKKVYSPSTVSRTE